MAGEAIGGQNGANVTIEGYFRSNTNDGTIRQNHRRQDEAAKSPPRSLARDQGHGLESGQQRLHGMVFLHPGESKLETAEAEGEVAMVDA